MSQFAVLLLLVLAACGGAEPTQMADLDANGVTGWRFASGKRPTHAEYAAIVAACQDGVVPRTRGRPLDTCLADLGLERKP